MKKRTAVLMAVVVILAGVLVGMGSLANQEKKLSHFSFILTQSAEGLEFRCEAGCGWERLTYSCGSKLPCTVVVDEHSVQGGTPSAKK